MCVYSAFVREADKQWPGLVPKIDPWINPGYLPMSSTVTVIDPQVLEGIREIIKLLKHLDAKLGAKDCAAEEAVKAEFEARIDALIKQANELKASVQCDDGACKT